jgi:hypothetical protein
MRNGVKVAIDARWVAYDQAGRFHGSDDPVAVADDLYQLDLVRDGGASD